MCLSVSIMRATAPQPLHSMQHFDFIHKAAVAVGLCCDLIQLLTFPVAAANRCHQRNMSSQILNITANQHLENAKV